MIEYVEGIYPQMTQISQMLMMRIICVYLCHLWTIFLTLEGFNSGVHANTCVDPLW